jgi:hypothetical protein
MLSKEDLSWTAGLIDGEGSFYVQIQDRGLNHRLTISPRLVVALKGSDKTRMTLEYIKESVWGCGALYQRKDGTLVLQTIKVGDSIKITKDILPYLRLKDKIARRFLSACYLTQKYVPSVRPKEVTKKLIDIALTLNRDGRCHEYRDPEAREKWDKLIEKKYGMEDSSRGKLLGKF